EAENEALKAIGEAQTLTLVRANYKFESLRGIQDVDLKTLMALDRGETEDMLGRGFARTGDLRDNSMGFSVLKLLKALKQSNLVPLLLVSADTDGLTVTTTEEFQQALGKFIRFLQEHE